MNDHNKQPLIAGEMVRGHAYPVLGAIANLSSVANDAL